MRYGELLAENCEFYLPHSPLTPSLGVNPFEFLDDFFIPKTRVLEDFVILACVFFTQCQGVTDGQTDRHPDRSYSWARTRGAQLSWAPRTARTQQKTTALGKPDAGLFIARTY